MKIQLLGLTAATALTFAPTVQAQVVSSVKILPVIDIQSNIAIGKNNFSQGTPQVSNLNIVQVAPISTPTTISIATPSFIGSHHGSHVPAAYSFTMPTVVSNIVIAPITQIQSNIAIGSTNGVQGGSQIANIGTFQAATLSGNSNNNGSSIANFAYTPITQYQSNFTADSYNLKQGGGSISNGTNIQTGTISK